MEEETINVDDFSRLLIADKCNALIAAEKMLPDNILSIVKNARDNFFANPSTKNYETIKKLFNQTKYVDDGIDYKDFNRRVLVIAIKFALNRSKDYFPNYKSVLELALKRLETINPDLKSSPRAMLQHYNECLENLDNPYAGENHLITFAKEIFSKMFIETIDLYSYNNKSPFDDNFTKPTITDILSVAKQAVKSRKQTFKPIYKIVTPIFTI
ncbi:hypothetical protein AhnVgp110 [Adoxophyes honmai nucleopolyhedrovirus]|uniref:Ac106 n=1 Tax=Adoxophyes honmai nucleopolyhedrovirus TaxID=224399 RepID=Q80LI6_NPVAH|nr:hypothetical protein AhnVgp110 [Adoxophyes honmai nucleopolyhedrovirus]BAC67361.1 hypothetical protein [Adoxophyes honmai nucleopolyhedrovirus]